MNRIAAKLSNSVLPKRDLAAYVWNKGGLTSLRGLLRAPFLHCKLPIFIGRGVRLLHARHARFGKNCYIGDYSVLNFLSANGVHFGDNVTIREFAWMQLTSQLDLPGDRIEIGNNTYIGPRANLGAAGPLMIGRNCQFGAGVSLIAENHEIDGGADIIDQGVSRKGITIGDGCWLGNNVIVLDGVTLGRGCAVGAGAVVTKSFPDNSLLVGNPARVLRQR